MKRYIALIRGINVGGKNKVSMPELKSELEKTNFTDVSTYINSGNLLFASTETDLVVLVSKIETLLKNHFDVDTFVSVIGVKEFRSAVEHAPDWWGKDPLASHNGLFVIAPAHAHEIIKDVGDIRPEYEKLDYHTHLIFWSAPVATYGRTQWSKLVSKPSYKKITIRNFNTVQKLYDLTN